uniref:DUF202 domain-containing protein n=1 Tax=Ascaris lumbricoides TaxID=6252 RepID=A0A0M3I957_ASCLU
MSVSDREASPSATTRGEIRSVLVRHWRAIERARLHTFHLWLLLFSITQIAITNYLLPKVKLLIYILNHSSQHSLRLKLEYLRLLS